MKTNRLVDNLERLKDVEYLPEKILDEIIQRLRQLDELKLLIYDMIEPMEALYEFLFEITEDC